HPPPPPSKNHAETSPSYAPCKYLRLPAAFHLNRTLANLRECGLPALPHRQLQFAPHDVENALHSGLSECAQAPQIRASDANGARAKRQCLDHVRPAAESAIHKNGNAAVDGLD